MNVQRARRRPAPFLLAAVAAALAALLLLWDWNWFKGLIEAQVQQRTGRSFAIGGDLDVDLGWAPRVVLEDVRLGNPSWARTPEMFSAERAEFTLDLRQFLAGRLLLPQLSLTAPKIALETAPGNENNWQLARPAPVADTADESQPRRRRGLPTVGRLRVDHGELDYFDPLRNTDLRVRIWSFMEGGAGAVTLKAEGRLQSLDFEGEARGGSVLALAQEQDAPYPFSARFRAGHTRVDLQGTVAGLQAMRAARLDLSIEGETASELHRLLGLVLPETPPYRLRGRLVHEGELWSLEDFSGQMGDSDLSGRASVRYRDGRPRLSARLQSRQLDLDDLAGFVGATPGTGRGETASAEQRRRAVREQAGDRILPDHAVDLERLRSMDADVRFQGLSLRGRRTPLERLDVHLQLDRGLLRLDPLDFGIAGGQVASKLVIDAREPRLAMRANVDFEQLDLARLMPADARLRSSAGLIGGRARLSGSGASTAQILASADGELGLAMRSGSFSNLLVEALGLDAAEALRLLLGGDRTVQLRCAVADLEAKDGVLRPRSFIADTTDTHIQVEGALSLRDETLDLTIRPLPKDFSPLVLRSPLHLEGSFKDPAVRIDRTGVLRAGTAALLGALVNPIAALLPLIETGPGKNEDCAALVAAVQGGAQPPAGDAS